MEKVTIKELESIEESAYKLMLEADPSEEAIRDYINRVKCYAAFIGDLIVGEYILIKTRPYTMELVNISVDEKFQGKGIGRQLVLDAINRARQEGAKEIEVGTGNSSISQLAFYQKCGFRIIGVDKDFFRRNYKEKIIENGIECVDMIRLSMDL